MVTKGVSKVLLVINGTKPKKLPDFKDYAKVICTDGAYHYFVENDIEPHIILGDFDSFNIEDVPESVRAIVRENQDLTDFAKALDFIIEENFSFVDVYGANGKESDHYLGNLSVGAQYFKRLELNFYDDYGRSFFVDKQIVLNDMMDRIVSLYPFPEANSVNSKGLFFPLSKMNLHMLGRIGTRNHAIENQVEINLASGLLLVFVSDYTVALTEKLYGDKKNQP